MKYTESYSKMQQCDSLSLKYSNIVNNTKFKLEKEYIWKNWFCLTVRTIFLSFSDTVQKVQCRHCSPLWLAFSYGCTLT